MNEHSEEDISIFTSIWFLYLSQNLHTINNYILRWTLTLFSPLLIILPTLSRSLVDSLLSVNFNVLFCNKKSRKYCFEAKRLDFAIELGELLKISPQESSPQCRNFSINLKKRARLLMKRLKIFLIFLVSLSVLHFPFHWSLAAQWSCSCWDSPLKHNFEIALWQVPKTVGTEYGSGSATRFSTGARHLRMFSLRSDAQTSQLNMLTAQ